MFSTEEVLKWYPKKALNMFAFTRSLSSCDNVNTVWKRLSIDAPPATRVVNFLCPKVPLPQSPFAMMDRHTQTVSDHSCTESDSITLTAYSICIRSHFMISRMGTNFAHVRVQNWRMCVCEINATLCLPENDCTPNAQVKLPEITFFYLLTLTFDLWPWPSDMAITNGVLVV